MRIPLLVLALLAASGTAAAQHQHGPAGAPPPVRLLEGLGEFHLPVATSVPDSPFCRVQPYE